MPFIDSCVPLDVSRVVGLVISLFVHVFSFLMLTDAVDITLSATRTLSLFVSLGALLLFVLVAIAKSMVRRRNYISNRIPSYESDVTYMSNLTGVLTYLTLTLLLCVVHLKNPPTAFDPVANPAANAQLRVIVLAYYLASAAWLVVTFFVAATIKGLEDRHPIDV